jgi:hypothetical protein
MKFNQLPVTEIRSLAKLRGTVPPFELSVAAYRPYSSEWLRRPSVTGIIRLDRWMDVDPYRMRWRGETRRF